MSLFSGLYVGASGLVTNQNALNTTAHNLSNIGTVGYTRQQVLQANRNYDTIGNAAVSSKQVGLGTNYADVRAVRDYFLDKAYRQETGRSAYYTSNYNVVTEMETLFGELEGTAFKNAMDELDKAIQELQKIPDDATNQGLLVSKAGSFLERAQAVYSGLSEYQENINTQIKDDIDKINEYGDKLWELNQKIIAIETGGIERANDLRDARDQILDELGELARITYDENIHGVLTVQIEGVDFVTQDYVNKMGYMEGLDYNIQFKEDIENGTKQPVDNDFYVPVWPLYKNQEVFSTTEIISSDRNTDIGALKALYNARGNKRATAADLDNTDGYYDRVTSRSSVMNVMAEFDNLVKGIVTGINQVLSSNNTPEGVKRDRSAGIEGDTLLFSRIDEEMEWTTRNLMINPEAQQTPSSVNNGFVLDDGSIDQQKADALVRLFSDPFSTLNPNTGTELTFSNYYQALIAENATAGSVYHSISTNQEAMTATIDSQRQEVLGVSDSDELTQMIRYQNAYNASSRYINTINSMLETLINSMT